MLVFFSSPTTSLPTTCLALRKWIVKPNNLPTVLKILTIGFECFDIKKKKYQP